jgi:transcriptional regulator with GAF, ATPase, and Fis domain
VWAFVNEFGEIMGKTIEQISQKSMDSLQRYYWPGNVRELRNVIERAIILCNDPILPIEVPKGAVSSTRENMTLTEVERNHIISILDMTGWRVRGKNGAAEILGLKPTTLDSKMAKLGIRRKK